MTKEYYYLLKEEELKNVDMGAYLKRLEKFTYDILEWKAFPTDIEEIKAMLKKRVEQ